MADNTKIEWTDATWNPVTGCSVVSPGCTNCYAMRLAGTRLKHVESRKGLTKESKAGPVWNGEVRFNEKDLDQPLRWRRPRLIFVCAHGDLFHENVPDEWIDRVFAVMALAPQHTFQVLTKRSARMRAYFARDHDGFMAAEARIEHRAKQLQRDQRRPIQFGKTLLGTMPWPHVWLGVSAEGQVRADERIPDLLATPAAVRFVSAEPLLGAIYLTRSLRRVQVGYDLSAEAGGGSRSFTIPGLDWVIVGGESGTGARPMHPDWARSLRDQCAAAGVAFHFKQWGEFLPHHQQTAEGLINSIGGPDDHRWHAFGDGESAWMIGKARAGRLLDGIEHNGMPEVRR